MERPQAVRMRTGRRVAALGSLAGVLLLLAAAVAAPAQAAPGDLDLTFSGDGKQRTDFGLGVSGPAAIALQPDGKIVAVGYAVNTHGPDFALARYNPDGSLDTSFGGDGKQTTDIGRGDEARGVTLQADGKIVVVGSVGASSATQDFALARYNPNGTLDTSFSGDGKQRTDFGEGAGATGVALRAGGKIVVVGRVGGSGINDFALARYSPNGRLDTSFSGDGRQRTGFADNATANGVALQGDGAIVAVGFAGSDFALARYNADGTLDTSFSGDGKQTTDFGDLETANGVALQADGKIVVVGSANGIGFSDFALARYNSDGSLDTSFSGDGLQTTDFGGFEGASGVALQGDGRIVAAGSAVGSAPGPGFREFALARYNSDGSLDTSFSGDGKRKTDSGFVGASGVALQGDGKIVAVGQAGGGDFGLVRYNPDGSLDTSFSGDGKQRTEFGGVDQANGVALQGDGKIVVVGGAGQPSASNTGQGADDAFALARYNPNGSLDTSLSGDGRQTTDFGGFDDQATAVALQGDGKIVVVGGGDNGDFALARYNADGSLDTSFSGDGKQTTDFGGSVDGARGVALQGDGKIVAVGRGLADFALARYNPDGSLDTSFSGDGRQTTDFGGGSVDGARRVALQGDGKIVAVGFTEEFGTSGDFALARYNPNGSLDTSFSGDGKQTTDFGGSDQANGVALQADGKIVAVGGANGDDFALARYNANGSLDTGFSGDGKQTADFGGSDQANGVALQGDGKIVAIGGANGDFALARYNPDGSLDTGFSGDGKQTTDFGGSDQANGVALQGDGNIVAVGVGFGTDRTNDFALARYLGA